MSKKLLFVIIATICTTTAFADTKTLTTQDYVDTNFQTKIPATSSDLEVVTKTLVATTDTAGQVEQMGVVSAVASNMMPQEALEDPMWQLRDSVIPTEAYVYGLAEERADAVRREKQNKIPISGAVHYPEGNTIDVSRVPDSVEWLRDYFKGTGLVTKTNTSGIVGERKIIETADVANYGTGTATQQQIQEISIPTMGAVMAAISANAPTLPTGTAGNVVTYNASGQIGGSVATYNGSTTYNASTDASKIAVMSAVQRKMTCARYVQNAAETPENCLLWNVPD